MQPKILFAELKTYWQHHVDSVIDYETVFIEKLFLFYLQSYHMDENWCIKPILRLRKQFSIYWEAPCFATFKILIYW